MVTLLWQHCWELRPLINNHMPFLLNPVLNNLWELELPLIVAYAMSQRHVGWPRPYWTKLAEVFVTKSLSRFSWNILVLKVDDIWHGNRQHFSFKRFPHFCEALSCRKNKTKQHLFAFFNQVTEGEQTIFWRPFSSVGNQVFEGSQKTKIKRLSSMYV